MVLLFPMKVPRIRTGRCGRKMAADLNPFRVAGGGDMGNLPSNRWCDPGSTQRGLDHHRQREEHPLGRN